MSAICLCGAQLTYPHRADCPEPLSSRTATEVQAARWAWNRRRLQMILRRPNRFNHLCELLDCLGWEVRR